MDFEKAHGIFMHYHLRNRTGDRRSTLERGHGEAETLFCQNVWWPLRGDFRDLHPQFEVLDWRGRSYYCSFAFITPHLRLIIEVKPFSTYTTEMDRQKYCNDLNRETFLFAMGYQVISFACDDVVHRPELCKALLRMVINRYLSEPHSTSISSVTEREIIRFACMLARPLRPIDVKTHLRLNHRTALRFLHSLCDKGLLIPVTGSQGKHVVKYELHPYAAQCL